MLTDRTQTMTFNATAPLTVSLLINMTGKQIAFGAIPTDLTMAEVEEILAAAMEQVQHTKALLEAQQAMQQTAQPPEHLPVVHTDADFASLPSLASQPATLTVIPPAEDTAQEESAADAENAPEATLGEASTAPIANYAPLAGDTVASAGNDPGVTDGVLPDASDPAPEESAPAGDVRQASE